MLDSSGDLRLEDIWAERGIMLPHLAWQLGPKWETPLEIEGLESLRLTPTCQQVSGPRSWRGEGEGMNPFPGTK